MSFAILTRRSRLHCRHSGVVNTAPIAESWVRIEGASVVCSPSPIGLPIVGCRTPPNPQKPCFQTVSIAQGLSDFVFVDGNPVCLDTLRGGTEGMDMQPDTTTTSGYRVTSAEQGLVWVKS